ncbi:MAG: ABC transporter ATP-binding protein [Candidatus Brocadiia bacterium]
MENAILTDNTAKTYGMLKKVHALKSVSLSVERGKTFGLLGRNGAGKTTLLKLLLGLIRPTKGKVSVFGLNPLSASARLPAGYLPENHRFPGYFTGVEALKFYSALSGLERAKAKRLIPEWVERVGLKGNENRKLRTYSKGMLQRIGLAQALIHDPQIVFLDEPTDGVDPAGRVQIRGILEEQKALGKTIFINSHLLSEIEKVCDEIAILDQGLVVSRGSLSDLTAQQMKYRFSVSDGSGSRLWEVLEGKYFIEDAASDSFTATVSDREDIPVIIDRLRAASISIYSVEKVKRSLEDVFMELTGGDDHGKR